MEKFAKVRGYVNDAALKGAMLVSTVATFGMGSAMAEGEALPAAVTSGVATAVAEILLVVALGGAAYITISSAGVIWGVASKFIKRLGGKA